MTICERNEAVRDYAFDELPAGERREMERHLAGCAPCATELEQLRLTTAALRSLPEQEIPQRIAFVSDKIFEPSPVARFFAYLRKSAPVLIASAALIAALVRPAPEVKTIVQTAAGVNVNQQIDEAVARAVRQVKAEDARITKVAIEAAEAKHDREHRMIVAAMEQNLEVMQKRMGAMTSLASLETSQNGTGQ